MGIFDKLFGKNEPISNNEPTNHNLRLEFNVINNVRLEESEKYNDPKLYKLIEDGIYQDLTDEDVTNYRMTISYDIGQEEEDNNNQYPLEDILEKYILYVSDFFENENKSGTNHYKFEFAGRLEHLKEAKEIFGTRIYNQDYLGKDGRVRVKLIIE